MIFQYAQLGANTIRLLRFHPRSTKFDLHVTLEHQANYSAEHVHYSVLSHEPMTPEAERKGVTLNGRTRMISSNAWHALSTVRKDHKADQRFWLQALCVNQSDVAEVKDQERHLPDIYAAADEVLIWLFLEGRDDPREGVSARDAAVYIDQAPDREALGHSKRVLLLSGKRRRGIVPFQDELREGARESL